ncbi:MAG TPA: glutamine-hydrolyzing GMP synthase [Sedimentisphaerales bacterium]|nr:glutamine-hydrolyzing GMP synthase [Sedimentisphaerales bacterium]HRS10359.1 glutamine-hydrolyzing GMP synthase [Sedimentisphaerales bacterium]HRV47064.1 glutamine-hydrolyzing GMP synthase [Sedimentisphaerales bacterium]
MIREMIAILDFGSQYGQLIGRRVREHHVYSRICPAGTSADELAKMPLKGIILSGGPASVYAPGAPKCDERIFDLDIPILGICYGMQLGCQILGAEITPAASREYGRATLRTLDRRDLLANLPDETLVWASHGDQVTKLGRDFVTLGQTRTCPYAAVRHQNRRFYGVQFHPEVSHTPKGDVILKNFLYGICDCAGDWKMSDFVGETIDNVRRQVGDATVICGLSGGVDSSVVASLIHKAVGDQLVCILVDNGLLRKNERENIVATFRDHFHIDLRVVDWSQQFLAALAGVTDPQQKRKIIGAEFIEAFKSEAKKIPNARFLAQGTLYPDVIESGSKDGNPAASIKLHHNVGGLPAELGFELVEPLRDLFKDEVRMVGEHLGLPEDMVWRHPFPGPGLGVRIVGEVTPAKLEVLRAADEILIDEIKAAGLYRQISQALAVLIPVSTVGVMGDERSYENVIALRAVETTDFMTADFSRIPYDVLSLISTRIINEVRGVNRVVYDISSKPPATIEWE